jgi:chromatin segregation and condensation protein Rec8/ScpA/Scc1 (kleisin family)
LFADVQTRAGLIVTFLALLEMIRLKLVRVFQSGAMAPIRVYKRARPVDAPKPILDPQARHDAEVAAHEHEAAAHAQEAQRSGRPAGAPTPGGPGAREPEDE